MLISEIIKMLETEKEKHGDISVYVDMDYGQRPVEIDIDPLCLSPEYQPATAEMPQRIVI